MRNETTIVIRDNVRRLMLAHGKMSQRELAKLAGIAQSSVSYITTYEDEHDRHPTSATIEAVARAFNVEPWQLMIPDVPLEVLQSRRLGKLLADYSASSDEGRKAVERVASDELRYARARQVLDDEAKK